VINPPLEIKGVEVSAVERPRPLATDGGSTTVQLPVQLVPTKPTLSGGAARTFVLALLGCPDAAKASEDACFHLSHRTWHSAMVTIMDAESTLYDIREQVVHSRLSHVPTNFCFLFNGHALDPNVEATIKAATVAVVASPPDSHGDPQHIVLIDNVHCNIGPTFMGAMASPTPGITQLLLLISIFCTGAFFVYLTLHHRSMRGAARRGDGRFYKYNRVPASAHEEQALMDDKVEPPADNGNSENSRIPCLPSRLRFTSRPMFKPTRYAPFNVKVATSPPHAQADASGPAKN